MSRKQEIALVLALSAGWPLSAAASDGGIMTRCHAESGGKRWAITDGDFSFEVCRARALDCTGDPNAIVHFENMGPVLIPFPAVTCTSRLPGGKAAGKPASK